LGGSQLVDLDLGTDAWKYTLRTSAVIAPTTPDGRLWYVPHCILPYRPGDIDHVLPLLKDSKLQDEVRTSGFVLAAWTIPHAEAKSRIDAHKAARALGGMSVRIVVAHDDAAYRRAAGEKVADALAEAGCHVSPKADGVARVTLSPIKNDMVEKVAGSLGPTGLQTQLVPGKIIEAKLEVFDGNQTLRWSTSFRESVPDSVASPEQAVRNNLLQTLRRAIVRSESQIAGTDQLPTLNSWSEYGIDGVPDPPVENKAKP
jgi:hypothetical protein